MLNVVELSTEQINNCQVFLNRANLTGAEAEAMVMIKMALNNAKPRTEYLGTKANSPGTGSRATSKSTNSTSGAPEEA